MYCGGCAKTGLRITAEFLTLYDKCPFPCPECSANDWWWDCLYSHPEDWVTSPGKLTGKFARPWWGREHP
jgi:hypothetical protein